jgi:hypothetical protein
MMSVLTVVADQVEVDSRVDRQGVEEFPEEAQVEIAGVALGKFARYTR